MQQVLRRDQNPALLLLLFRGRKDRRRLVPRRWCRLLWNRPEIVLVAEAEVVALRPERVGQLVPVPVWGRRVLVSEPAG